MAKRKKSARKVIGRPSVARRAIERAATQASSQARTKREAKQVVKRIVGRKLSERERFEIAREAQRLLDKRQKDFSRVQKKLRVRKDDPKVVFVLAKDQTRTVGFRKIKTASAGDRVTRGDRRKVFIFRRTRATEKHPKGRLVPYQDYEEKERLKELRLARKKVPPRPMPIQDFDPNQFESKQVTKWYYAGRKRAHKVVTVQKIKRRKAPKPKPKKKRVRKEKRAPVRKPKPVFQRIDFMSDVVPKVAMALQDAADRYQDRREFELECAAVVRLPSGKTMAPRFEVNFKQSDMQQFMDLGFYEPFVSRKLYAEFAEQLKGMGLVTTGSAQHIAALPINRGRERKDWKDGKGFAWKHGQGWKLQECDLVRFDAVPNYIIVRSGE